MAAVTVSRIGQALAILAEVIDAEWPSSREAQAAIRFKLDELTELLAIHDALISDELDPYSVDAPDKGWWDAGNPLPQALEFVDDEALQCAIGLRKRLAEHQRREAARQDAETLIAARRIAGMAGLGI